MLGGGGKLERSEVLRVEGWRFQVGEDWILDTKWGNEGRF